MNSADGAPDVDGENGGVVEDDESTPSVLSLISVGVGAPSRAGGQVGLLLGYRYGSRR